MTLAPFGFTCACCGKTVTDLPDVGFDAPLYYAEVSENERTQDTELSPDFCVVEGKHFFVRGVCLLPIQGSDRSFGWGVWSTLSETNFRRYKAAYGDSDQSRLGGMFGWFSNRLPCYPDTLGLRCSVRPQDGEQRPHLCISEMNAEHPLYREQQDGLTPARLGEIYAEVMCDTGKRE